MHLLFIALLSILAGVLLLAKTRKEQLGKFFTFIAWFFVVVGFILFVGFIFGATWRLTHRFPPGRAPFHHKMMMQRHQPAMPPGKCCAFEMKGGSCCAEGMSQGNCCAEGMKAGKCCKAGMKEGISCGKMCRMGSDSVMKCCRAHAKTDSLKLP